MNEKKIAFIICANDAQYYNECVKYIQELTIPDGYETDIICIQEADSIAVGYNAGMYSSDAKYKVYLQQNIFLLNQDFIYEIVKVFRADPDIGMLGMAGMKNMPSQIDEIPEWDLGRKIYSDGYTCEDYWYGKTENTAYSEAAVLGGGVIVTQYDIPWREDLLTGWKYYELSHSLEIQRSGYKVVVPKQDTAWSHEQSFYLVDTYVTDNAAGLEQEYSLRFPDQRDKRELIQKIKNIKSKLICLMEGGYFDEVANILSQISDMDLMDSELKALVNIMEIHAMEQEYNTNAAEKICNFLLCSEKEWRLILELYNWLLFALLRIGYQKKDQETAELKTLLDTKQLSEECIWKMLSVSKVSSDHIYRLLLGKTEMDSLVSVVVLVYNGEETIADTLDSILKQTYKNLEVIVVDDGSSDTSRKIIDTYTDDRIQRIYMDKNSGVCCAGNVGFSAVHGKYVALIGHDDVWHKEKIEKQVSFLESHPTCAVCFTWADIFDENNNHVNDKCENLYQRFHSNNRSKSGWLRKLFWENNFFCAPSACIRKESLEQVGYYRYSLVQLQDYDLWLRLLNVGYIYIIQEKLVLYRQFTKSGRNLSEHNQKTENRSSHELQWLQWDLIRNMPSKEFISAFYRDFIRKDAKEEYELLFEKLFLLKKNRNCYSIGWFMDLLEDDHFRQAAEEKYGFMVKDFYKINTETMFFDYEPVWQIQALAAEKREI